MRIVHLCPSTTTTATRYSKVYSMKTDLGRAMMLIVVFQKAMIRLCSSPESTRNTFIEQKLAHFHGFELIKTKRPSLFDLCSSEGIDSSIGTFSGYKHLIYPLLSYLLDLSHVCCKMQ